MTTSDIANLANKGSLATAEFQIQTELRRNVVPRFLADVDAQHGKVQWRRNIWSFSTVANTRQYAAPLDFGWSKRLVRGGTSQDHPPGDLTYIGEREDDVLAAELNHGVAIGTPSGYYFKFGVPQVDAVVATAVPRYQLFFDKTPNAVSPMVCLYQRLAYFADDAASVDLDLYIPPDKQYPLVLLLRAAIYEDRFGSGDERFVDAMADYTSRLATLGDREPAAAGQRTVYVRG